MNSAEITFHSLKSNMRIYGRKLNILLLFFLIFLSSNKDAGANYTLDISNVGDLIEECISPVVMKIVEDEIYLNLELNIQMLKPLGACGCRSIQTKINVWIYDAGNENGDYPWDLQQSLPVDGNVSSVKLSKAKLDGKRVRLSLACV